jgi:hypothetical protein|tara:strand:+ start:297 stop:695 length:399 start_codon:yes stop_codon:yes gene_type:complete
MKKHFKKEYTSKFDIDLKFGESFEYSLGQILNMGKIEIKTERDIWVDTGNIAIELMNQGNASGLSVTEAEWWAQILSFKGDIKSIILLPVEELKKKVKHSVQHGQGRIVMGGDDNASEIALIPIKEIHETKS